MREINKQTMIDLIIEAKRTAPETGSFAEWLAEYLAEHLPTLTPPNEWVSVEKGLPKAECGESDSVLAITELGTMHVVYSDGGCWCRPTGETFPHKITHWMLLPVPPDRRPQEGEDA